MLKFKLGDALSSVRFLPDGNLLGLRWWGETCQLVIWKLPTMEETILLQQELSRGIRIQVTYDESLDWIAIGSPIRQVMFKKRVFVPPPLNRDRREQVSISPSGTRMIVASRRENWRPPERKFLTLNPNKSIQFSYLDDPPADYTLLGFNHSDAFVVGKQDAENSIEVQSFDVPSLTSRIQLETGPVSHFAFCVNRTRLVLRCTKTWAVEFTDPPKVHRVQGVPFSDGVAGLGIHPTLPIAGIVNRFSSVVSLSNFATQSIAHRYDWEIADLNSVDFSPDGLLGMVADDAGNLVLWDIDE